MVEFARHLRQLEGGDLEQIKKLLEPLNAAPEDARDHASAMMARLDDEADIRPHVDQIIE